MQNTCQNICQNIWAVGRNYPLHAQELGNPVPAKESDPMIFLKAGSSIVGNGKEFRLPKFSSEAHHEVEVALQFGADLKISALTVAIDLTLRDVQDVLKSKGHPWTLAKSFRDACLIGPLVPLPTGADLQNLEFILRVNGKLRQQGNTKNMIHSVESLQRYVLERFPVVEGDLLLTGTPAGVAAIRAGDRLEAEIKGHVKAEWSAAQPRN